MKFVVGERPEWKGKPKASPLDTDVEFLQLRNLILQGQMSPFQEAGIKVHEETDGKRLKTRNPAPLAFISSHPRRAIRRTKRTRSLSRIWHAKRCAAWRAKAGRTALAPILTAFCVCRDNCGAMVPMAKPYSPAPLKTSGANMICPRAYPVHTYSWTAIFILSR